MIKKTTLAALAAASLVSMPAHAVEKLYTPYVEKGEWELEYFGSRSNDSDAAKNNAQAHEFSVGYGLTEWWRTEIESSFERTPQERTTFDAWSWENIFQLTEQGKYWLDVGALAAYAYTPQSTRPDTLEGRLLLAKDTGRFSHTLDLIVEKEVGSGPKEGATGALLWSSRYRLNSYFEPGFEISSDFGEIKHMGGFDDQQHYLGPAAYGHIPLGLAGHGDALRYRVGYLFGISKAASSGDAVAQLEYEIRF